MRAGHPFASCPHSRPPFSPRIPTRAPPFRLVCGFASNVCALPHTNDASTHKSVEADAERSARRALRAKSDYATRKLQSGCCGGLTGSSTT